MKATKVYFEHHLNAVGQDLKKKLQPGDLADLDPIFEAWRNSVTSRPFGTILRKDFPRIFKIRYEDWHHRVQNR